MFPRGIWNYRGVRRLVDGLSTTTRALIVAGFVGFVIVLIAWLVGPGLFAGAAPPERVLTASVTEPVPCTAADPMEKVRFTDGGKQREASLPACGHDKGEELAVAVPEAPAAGPLTVRSAETHAGHSNVRTSIGLLLLALGCVGGGGYAFLVSRAERPVRKMASAH